MGIEANWLKNCAMFHTSGFDDWMGICLLTFVRASESYGPSTIADGDDDDDDEDGIG